MVSTAFAADAAAAPGGPQGIMGFLPLILIFVVFYFLLIRPQQKKAKAHQDFIASLKKGDEVVTSGGIQGKITGLTERVATVEIADGVRVKVSRPYILGPVGGEEQAGQGGAPTCSLDSKGKG